MFAPVRINPNVSRLPVVAVSVGTVPPAHRTVANQAVIVEGVVPCRIDTINTWLFVTLETANVIAVPDALPVTICILSARQFIVTVCDPDPGEYVSHTVSLPCIVALPVITPPAFGNAASAVVH